MGLAAGEDLAPYLRSLGITVEAEAAPPPADLAARLATCEVRRRHMTGQRQQDTRNYADYVARAGLWADDSWRAQWRLDALDSWFPLDVTWADDIRWFRCYAERERDPSSPPSTWPYSWSLNVFDESRRGVLVLWPPSAERPCQVTRTLQIPGNGRTVLYVGATRRRVSPDLALVRRTAIALRVDGQVVWRRPLDTDRWLHMPIDLSRWKGKTVDLALECQLDGDKTRGQAEVLLDYLTILTQE